MLLKAGKGSGGAGGFGDREGRGRREEDPDAGRYIDPGTATFLCFSRLSFLESNYQLPQILSLFSSIQLLSRSDQSDDWRRGPPPPQREGYQVEILQSFLS